MKNIIMNFFYFFISFLFVQLTPVTDTWASVELAKHPGRMYYFSGKLFMESILEQSSYTRVLDLKTGDLTRLPEPHDSSWDNFTHTDDKIYYWTYGNKINFIDLKSMSQKELIKAAGTFEDGGNRGLATDGSNLYWIFKGDLYSADMMTLRINSSYPKRTIPCDHWNNLIYHDGALMMTSSCGFLRIDLKTFQIETIIPKKIAYITSVTKVGNTLYMTVFKGWERTPTGKPIGQLSAVMKFDLKSREIKNLISCDVDLQGLAYDDEQNEWYISYNRYENESFPGAVARIDLESGNHSLIKGSMSPKCKPQ